MSMSWGAKIKAAFQGEVDGSDALSLLAGGTAMAPLQQQLADRRFDAELSHVGAEWQVPDALVPVAVPLWVADNFLTVAQSLCEMEKEAHLDRPTAMSPLVHGQALTLGHMLNPLIMEASAALADSTRWITLSLPLLVQPYTQSPAGLQAEHVPILYVRGLLRAAESVGGSAQVLLDDYAKLIGRATPPPWLSAGLSQVKTELATAQTQLDILRARGIPLARNQALDDTGMRTLAMDCWHLINTYLRLGQMILAPRLIPGAPPIGQDYPQPQPAWGPPPVALPAQDQDWQQPAYQASTPDPGWYAPSGPPAPPDPAWSPNPVEPRTVPEPPPAMASLAPQAAVAGSSAPAAARHIEHEERWLFSSRGARRRLRTAGQEEQAVQELDAFWEARGWQVAAQEQAYLDQVQALLAAGTIVHSGRSLTVAPFAPIYLVGATEVQLGGRVLDAGTRFAYGYLPGQEAVLTSLPLQVGEPDET